MQKAWDFALERVLVLETRIRMEVNMVGGEEVDCLVWIPSQSPKLSDKSIRQTRGANVKTFDKVSRDLFFTHCVLIVDVLNRLKMHPCSRHETTQACGKGKPLKMWKARSTLHQCLQLNASKSDKCLYQTGTSLTCSSFVGITHHNLCLFIFKQAFWLGGRD
jgi:hypothetical protein